MSSPFLDKYEILNIIGRGSFGTVRKVRRDGEIFARKELNIKNMSDNTRKRTVSEINILKGIRHKHIVRYYERYTDHKAGLQYIIMEYCGGGDLSDIITQALKENRVLSEDAIWRYFRQITLALHHCHHPNDSGDVGHHRMGGEPENSQHRLQILHRDLKPENIFLDKDNNVKLGDFGLSKALVHTGFTHTVVGTPLYMSPEVILARPYDSKSDIWSLGCLLFELVTLKQPFQNAKTGAELKSLISIGRIPPLPKTCSQSLCTVIKNMLNVNAVMRPETGQLLETCNAIEAERIRLQYLQGRENDLNARARKLDTQERGIQSREADMLLRESAKEREYQAREATMLSREAALDCAIKEAIAAREKEIRTLIQEELATANAQREDEIVACVNAREREFRDAWREREEAMEERIRWCERREQELVSEGQRVNGLRQEVEDFMANSERASAKVTDQSSHRTLFDGVENGIEPFRGVHPLPTTPGPSRIDAFSMPGSAMKGVILTSTGEALVTPAPPASLFANSPKVALDFANIFEEEGGRGINESPSRRPPAWLRRPSVTLPDAISRKIIHARAYDKRSEF